MVVVREACAFIARRLTGDIECDDILFVHHRFQSAVHRGHTDGGGVLLREIVDLLRGEGPVGLVEGFTDSLALVRIAFH